MATATTPVEGKKRGRKVKDPNATPAQTLVESINNRVTRLFRLMELVGNLGVGIKETEGIPGDAIVNQIMQAFAVEAGKLQQRLKTGEKKAGFEVKLGA